MYVGPVGALRSEVVWGPHEWGSLRASLRLLAPFLELLLGLLWILSGDVVCFCVQIPSACRDLHLDLPWDQSQAVALCCLAIYLCLS